MNKFTIVLLILCMVITGENKEEVIPSINITATNTYSPTPRVEEVNVTTTPIPTSQPTIVPIPNILFDHAKLATIDKNILYCSIGRRNIYMDLYYPRILLEPWKVIILIHGGGWVSGDKSVDFSTRFASPLQAKNYLVAAINYRLAPEHIFPASLKDAQCAVRYLRANAEKYNIDPNSIAALGHSAGGHIAALLGAVDSSNNFSQPGGYTEYSSRIQAVIAISAPINLRLYCNPAAVILAFNATDCDDEKLYLANPANYLTLDDPPFLIFHGIQDKAVAVEHAYYLKEKLDHANIFSLMYLVDNAGHTLDEGSPNASLSFDEMVILVIEFLTNRLNGDKNE